MIFSRIVFKKSFKTSSKELAGNDVSCGSIHFPVHPRTGSAKIFFLDPALRAAH
jgi:hypothetical protein